MNSKVVIFTFLSNLVFTPFFTLLLCCIPLFFLFLPIPFLVSTLSWIMERLSEGVYALATSGNSFTAISFPLGYAFMPILILLLFTALAILIVKKKYNFLPLAAILLFFLAANLGIVINDIAWQNKNMVYFHTDKTSDSLLLYQDKKGMVVDFSYSSRFVLESFETIKAEFPSVYTDTLMLTNCRATHLNSVQKLVEEGSIKHLLIPYGSDAAEAIYTYAKKADIDVHYYSPQDTIVWNNIALATHKDTTDYNVSAIEITLTNKTLLYLKENAPTLLNVRFGPLSNHYDVVFHGAFGAQSNYASFDFDANQVVQSDYLVSDSIE